MDTKQAGNLSYWLSVLLDKLARVDDTSSVKCWTWAKSHATGFSGNPSGADTFHDQEAPEIHHTSKHGGDPATGRGGRVSPRFSQQSQTRPGVLDTVSFAVTGTLPTSSRQDGVAWEIAQTPAYKRSRMRFRRRSRVTMQFQLPNTIFFAGHAGQAASASVEGI